ncbi:SixA phosphatase family protein [Methylobacterium nigriterrae]|uniref:SixA phosphatase family protein n=1 Tax=Methylobacterium nigriterrae TaxID=3127512 RepID=UPI003013625E
MLRLLLLRHAKSDRPAGVADLDRPLNPRGRKAAPLMAAYLAEQELRPDLALVSPARRTRETWEPVGQAIGQARVELVDGIYEAPASALLAVIRDASDARSLMLVGHNPGLQNLAIRLAGAGSREDRARLRTQFPTAALAVIDFEADAWREIGWGGGRLERFLGPRDIARGSDD